jgi:hypothetical protein
MARRSFDVAGIMESPVLGRRATARPRSRRLKEAQAALTAFAAEARGQYQYLIGELTTGLGEVKTAVGSSVPEAMAELPGVKANEELLLAAVNTRCPSASPSPGA